MLAVVHGPFVRPELFGEVIVESGHELHEWAIREGSDPPSAVDAVLVLGGHMNVGEEASHPWLEREYELIRAWVAQGTPLLGICLGAQTLAHAFGAAIAPAPARLAGFLELSLTPAGRRDPLLGGLPPRFPALFANAYAFTLPPGAAELAQLPAGPQAFRVGECAWGLQFHPEARVEQVLSWWEEADDLPRAFASHAAELAAGMESWQRLGREICRAFLDVASA